MSLEAERLEVLKMVESRRVSPEDGARLLAALRGRQPPAGPAIADPELKKLRATVTNGQPGAAVLISPATAGIGRVVIARSSAQESGALG